MKLVYNNFESHKMGAKKIPSECLWFERWPVWGYVGIESAQSSFYPTALRADGVLFSPMLSKFGKKFVRAVSQKPQGIGS